MYCRDKPLHQALQVATINTARHYRLRNFGAIAPRFWADFVVFDDLNEFRIRQTYKKGILVGENGKYLAPAPAPVPQPRSTMNLRYKAPADFEVRLDHPAKIRVIEIVPGQIVTRQLIENPRTDAGRIVPDLERDILKLVVIERHHATAAGCLVRGGPKLGLAVSVSVTRVHAGYEWRWELVD